MRFKKYMHHRNRSLDLPVAEIVPVNMPVVKVCFVLSAAG